MLSSVRTFVGTLARTAGHGLGRRLAVRLVGVAIAVIGLAFIGLLNVPSPMSHAKLTATPVVAADRDDADRDKDCDHTADRDVDRDGDHDSDQDADRDGDHDADCDKDCDRDADRDGDHDTDRDGDRDDDCATHTSSTSTHAGSSTVTAGSSTTSVAPGVSTSSTSSTGVKAAVTTPTTGADVESGAGLALIITGSGLVAAAARMGRRPKN